jgi:ERF superfamily
MQRSGDVMHRSSESIAALAAALAKAQAELVNPEKTQIATLEVDKPGSGGRSFRYAPLSTGLDIVRKTLSQQAIATLQTTAIDQATSTVKLTTILAHASGEWIASDWPVCAVEDTATPHRMGAALTYARRYALFTLVGIAGEDDIDAPDLAAAQERAPRPQRGDKPGSNGSAKAAPDRAQPPARGDAGAMAASATSILPPEESQALHDQLVKELADLASKDAMTVWARETLPAKNRLTVSHAQALEQAFLTRLAVLHVDETDDASAHASPQGAAAPALSPDTQASSLGASSVGKSIDKGTLALPEPRRIRDRDHVKFVATQPCLICGRRPADAHHIRFAQPRALSRKVSDEFTVPLCRGHHRAVHHAGDEATWWKAAAVDPVKVARKLWRRTRPLKARLPAATTSAVARPREPAPAHDAGRDTGDKTQFQV